MNEMMTSTFLVVTEFAIVFGVLVVILAILMFKRWKGSQKDVKSLVAKLKSNEEKRKKKRSELFTQILDSEQTDIDSVVDQVFTHEKMFYSKLIKVFLGNQKDSLGNLDEHVEALIQGCYSPLSKQTAINTTDADPEKEDLVDTIKQLMDENHFLTKENERIAKELQGLKDETEHVLNEYVSIFNKRDKTDSTPT